jgi:ribosomal protein S18 acetylase RimI-like enzyme
MNWFSIRPARSDDQGAVEKVVRDAYSVYVSRIGREPAPMAADYGSLITSREVWVAEAFGEVVGVLVVREEKESLLLENVAVTPACQRRGVGRALIAHAEHHARDLRLSEIRLYTNEQMTENLRLYPRLGFIETGRRVESGFARVYFRKALDRL